MISMRFSLLTLGLLIGILISCSKSSKAPKEEKVTTEKKRPPQTASGNATGSSVEEKKEKEKEKEKVNEKKSEPLVIESLDLVPVFDNHTATVEKGKNAKVKGVSRDNGNSQKVLDILVLDKKKIDENKILTTAKKGQPPTFIPCETNDVPIVRLTNTRLIDEKYPAVSSNGEFLVYEGWHRPESGENTTQGLYCTQLDSSLQRSVLVKNGFFSVRPFFHPNLKEVYFSTDSYLSEFRIASVSLDGSGSANLDFRKICRDAIDVSISNKFDFAISYFKDGKSSSSIGLVSHNGIFYPEIAEGKEVSWSSSGDRIVFVNSNGLYLDVFTVKADGTDLVQVTTHFGICRHPTFSPDEKWIVFSAINEVNKKNDLFIVQKDGKNLMQITNATENDRNPSWGKDGWIYFETDRFEGNSELAKIDSSFFIKKFVDSEKPPVFLK